MAGCSEKHCKPLVWHNQKSPTPYLHRRSPSPSSLQPLIFLPDPLNHQCSHIDGRADIICPVSHLSVLSECINMLRGDLEPSIAITRCSSENALMQSLRLLMSDVWCNRMEGLIGQEKCYYRLLPPYYHLLPPYYHLLPHYYRLLPPITAPSDCGPTAVISTADLCSVSTTHCLCVSGTWRGVSASSRHPYSNFSNRPHPHAQNRGAVPMR